MDNTAAVIYGAIIIGALGWGIANRLWGSDHPINKFMAASLVFFPTIFCGTIFGLTANMAAIAGIIAVAGFFLGRISDGVRGTYLQKGLRGWKYSGIPLGFMLLTGNPVAALALPFFWQGGAGEWAAAKLVKPGSDYTAWAEPADGMLRGFLNLLGLHLAIAAGAVFHVSSWVA